MCPQPVAPLAEADWGAGDDEEEAAAEEDQEQQAEEEEELGRGVGVSVGAGGQRETDFGSLALAPALSLALPPRVGRWSPSWAGCNGPGSQTRLAGPVVGGGRERGFPRVGRLKCLRCGAGVTVSTTACSYPARGPWVGELDE